MRKVSMKKKDKKNGNAEEEVDSAGEEVNTEENGDADPLEDPLTKEEQDDENEKEKEVETKKKSKKSKKSKVEKEAKVDEEEAVEEENKSDAEENDDEEEEEEEEEYEVENIVGHKSVKGKLLYQIRWKGYGKDSDTWEPEDTVSCPDIVLKYNEKNKVGVSKGKKRPSSIKKSPAKKSKATKDVSADPEKEWEVDRIIDVHSKKKGGREFLIRWKGYGAAHDSWEPEDNVNSPDLIEKFLQKLGDVQGSTQKELRTAPKHTKHFTLAMDQSGRRLSRRNNNRQRAVYYDAE